MDSLGGRLRKRASETLSGQIDQLLGSALKSGSSALRQGSKFIKKKWKTRSGQPLLVEMLGYRQRKKRRAFSNKRSVSVKRRKVSVATRSARTGKKQVGHAGRRVRFARRGVNKKMRMARAIRSAQIYLQNPFVYRFQGQELLFVQPNKRASYTGRVYNWHSDPAGGGAGYRYVDFANEPTLATNGTNGFLQKMPLNSIGSALVGTSDRLNTYDAYMNRYQPETDANRRLYLWPTKVELQWRNNSDIGCKIEFFVFKALQDIPRKNLTPNADVTDYSPLEMWARGLGSGALGADNTGLSNLVPGAVVENRLAYVSDARRTYNKHWKIVSKSTMILQPGDETKQYVTQPGRYLDLYQLRESMDKWGTGSYGCWALKGDYVVVSLLEGQLVTFKDAVTPATTSTAGTAGISFGSDGSKENAISLMVKKQFKGVLIPQMSTAYYQFDNNLDVDQADTSEQKLFLPSVN